MRKIFILCLGLGIGLNVGIFLTNNLPIATKEYIPHAKWNEVCWGKALEALDKTKDKPTLLGVKIISKKMIFGLKDSRDKNGHAWIEFKFENGKTLIYDPSRNAIFPIEFELEEKSQ